MRVVAGLVSSEAPSWTRSGRWYAGPHTASPLWARIPAASLYLVSSYSDSSQTDRGPAEGLLWLHHLFKGPLAKHTL